MQKQINKKELSDSLKQLIAELDAAISLAIENPLLFLGSPRLNAIDTRCAALGSIQSRIPLTEPESDARQRANIPAALEALIWEVRERAGRLQRLLDSAAHFYSCCFSSPHSACLAYGVHGEWGQVGEWGQMANPGHLVLDC